jgi:hypothetical protein
MYSTLVYYNCTESFVLPSDVLSYFSTLKLGQQIWSDALVHYNRLISVTLQKRVNFRITCTATSNLRKTWQLQEICIRLVLMAANIALCNQTGGIVNGGNHKWNHESYKRCCLLVNDYNQLNGFKFLADVYKWLIWRILPRSDEIIVRVETLSTKIIN